MLALLPLTSAGRVAARGEEAAGPVAEVSAGTEEDAGETAPGPGEGQGSRDEQC